MSFKEFIHKIVFPFDNVLHPNEYSDESSMLALTSTDKQTLYFRNGHLYRIIGGNPDNWYDADIIVSDGHSFNLSVCSQIRSIPIPDFALNFSPNGYGITGSLDYVLRMKAGNCFNRKEKELCSACLWKSTEMMLANKYCGWRQKDFERIVDWHVSMNMPDEAKKAKQFLESKGFIIIQPPIPKENISRAAKKQSPKTEIKKMSYSEKERFIVISTTIEHVRKLSNFKFSWDLPLQKELSKNAHPFVYMNISKRNVPLVSKDLSVLNSVIRTDLKKYPSIPQLSIPINNLIFTPPGRYGYSRFMFTVIDENEEITDFPVSLFFATDFSDRLNSTHGDLIYNKQGEFSKANIYFWRNGLGYFLKYLTINGQFTLVSLKRS